VCESTLIVTHNMLFYSFAVLNRIRHSKRLNLYKSVCCRQKTISS